MAWMRGDFWQELFCKIILMNVYFLIDYLRIYKFMCNKHKMQKEKEK
jgi:hypothetical protein